MHAMTLESFNVRYRNDIAFGVDICRSALESYIRSTAPRRAFLVTGRRSAKVSGAYDVVAKVLEEQGITFDVFDRVSTNPSLSIAEECLEHARRANPDVIIAIGGGSVIDVAKNVALALATGCTISDLFWGRATARGKVNLVAINLTHGSGTEADRYAVLTDESTCIKRAVVSEYAYPSLSIDDPKFTTTLPRDQTIYTSIDAFYHCLEASSSVFTSPFTRTLAETGLRLIVQHIARAVFDPHDIEARYWLMYAALLGGICIDNSRTHLVHAVEHAISGLRPDIAHGLGLAVVGPRLISFLYSKAPHAFSILRCLIPDLRLRPEEHRRVEHYLTQLVRQFGIECSLTYLKLGKDDIPRIVKLTYEGSPHLLDMAPYKPDEAELKNILEQLVT